MDDLVVPAGPGAPDGLRIPAAELTETFSHASGPGGQSVNTTDSRVQLSLDLTTTTALDPVQRARVLSRLSGPVLAITASEHRSQHQNRLAARRRLALTLRQAVIPPIPRRPTKPTKASLRRRAESKQHRSETKRLRRRPDRLDPPSR